VLKVNCMSGNRTSNLDTDDCEDPCPECTSCNADFWPDLQCSAEDGDNLIGDPIELVPDRNECQQFCRDTHGCHFFSYMFDGGNGICLLHGHCHHLVDPGCGDQLGSCFAGPKKPHLGHYHCGERR